MKTRNYICFGFCILILGITACSKKTTNAVALIESKYEISQRELSTEHSGLYYGVRFQDNKYKGYEEALNVLVDKKLMELDFIERELYKDEELMSSIQRVINEELLVLYFDEAYLKKFITDEVIEDFYKGLGKQVFYKQIVLFKNNEDLNELKRKGLELKEIAETTGDFDALVSQFSEDQESKRNGGKMLPLNWMQATKTKSAQVIFRIPKGATQVIETLNSILVVQVYDVKEYKLPPLEELRSDIWKQLKEIYVERALKVYDADKQNLTNSEEYKWNSAGLEKVVEWSKIDGFYENGKYKSIIQEELKKGNNAEILTYADKTVDLQEYQNLLDNYLLLKVSPTNVRAENIKQYLDEALKTEIIVKKAKEMGLEKNIVSMETPSEVIPDELTRLYKQKFIWDRTPEFVNENIQAFYNQTKDSLFYQYDKVNLHVRIFDTENEANAAYESIKAGISFNELFKSWEVKSYYINKKGEKDVYMSNEPAYFKDIAFTLKKDEVSSPFRFTNESGIEKFAILKAANIESQKILKPDEVLPARLKRMYNTYYYDKFYKEITTELRNKYSVWINYELLTELAANYKGR